MSAHTQNQPPPESRIPLVRRLPIAVAGVALLVLAFSASGDSSTAQVGKATEAVFGALLLLIFAVIDYVDGTLKIGPVSIPIRPPGATDEPTELPEPQEEPPVLPPGPDPDEVESSTSEASVKLDESAVGDESDLTRAIQQ